MNSAAEFPTTHRFAAFAARGTITLYDDTVHVKRFTHLGRWEQTIPLAHLSPMHGTLFATTQLYVWSWILSVIFLAVGVWGLIYGKHDVPRITFCTALVASCSYFVWCLVRNRHTEWAIFSSPDHGCNVSFTRQGPDRDDFESFRTLLKERIERARQSE